MKVLFAVNDDSISETIVKKYQKEYKEIISYKSVYYFNAIVKELQKDKSYDRIVISEDLEQFTNTNYEQMDKFIFERLDSVSDEASNMKGGDIPIILICSERRTKSEPILVKLFGIGIYNAIIGTDRNIDEICKLIRRPRLKKDAKAYYRIDSEEVSYKAENENDVSEVEIQNIIAHFKRLGKNEDRYLDSFNNIAAQYNDTQLRIISKFLPLSVRAVLEEKSPKYQQVMSFNNVVSQELKYKKGKNQQEDQGLSEKLLKTTRKAETSSNPIVVPTAIKSSSNATKLARKKASEHAQQAVEYNRNIQQPMQVAKQQYTSQPKTIEPNNVRQQPVVQLEDFEDIENLNTLNNVEVKKRRGRPRKNPLPGIEEVQSFVEEPQQDMNSDVNNNIISKKRRGRPRKNPVAQEYQDDSYTLPGIEEESYTLPGIEYEEQIQSKSRQDDYILPGVEQEDYTLPGIKQEEYIEPKIERETYYDEDETESNVLPGFYEENIERSRNNVQQNVYEEESSDDEGALLPGFNSQKDEPIQNNNYRRNFEQDVSQNSINNYNNGYSRDSYNGNQYVNNNYINNGNLTDIVTDNQKIVAFVGTSKNGTSFIVNNLAILLSSMGINIAILDTTQNRNSYYIYTQNEEDLRKTAYSSIPNLINGQATGIKVNNNLTVYTSLPNEGKEIENVQAVLGTLLKNHSLILIDCDFSTPRDYFVAAQEVYLVQTMDILTIQPLTAFLKELMSHNILDEKKIRIVINKFLKIKGIGAKEIIGGMSKYNDPAMSFMTDLFDRDMAKYITILFEEETYTRYLEGVINCEISLKGYSKMFLQNLKQLGSMVYPAVASKGTYAPPSAKNRNNGGFSADMNDTLNKMKNKY